MKPSLLRRLLLTIFAILLGAFILGQVIGLFMMRKWFLNEEMKNLVPRMMKIVEEIKITDGTISITEESQLMLSAYDLENNPIIINRGVKKLKRRLTDEEIRNGLLPYMERVVNGEKIACITYIEGMKNKFMVIGVPIKEEGEIIGSLFMIKLASDYNMIINGFYIIFLITTLCSVIIILVLVYYFTKKQIRPLVEMVGISNAMAAGDYNIRAKEGGYGEVKELSDSLNCLGEKLLEARVQAERYEQTRRDYIANISHELRTPISSIRAISETLCDYDMVGKEKRKKYDLIILRETKRLQKLINEMLDLSRLQSSEEVLAKEQLDGKELIQEVADYFEIFAEDTNIIFKVTENALNIPDCYSNKERIMQILVILLDNAFKFTPEDGTVTVDATWDEELINISVTNTGEGIADEDMPFIFERFYKGDKSHNGGGSGLGLSLVKEIMRHLEEQIRVSCMSGELTKFEFTIHRYMKDRV